MKKRPIGVTLIGILILLSSIFGLISGGILLIMGIGSLGLAFTGMFASMGLGVTFGILGLFFGAFLFIISLLNIIVSIAFLKGKNWARIFLIITHSLGIIMSGISLFSGMWFSIISIVFNLLIILYLLINKNAKRYFK